MDRLDVQAEKSEDPDGFGIYDQCEYILGFGFVACQTYITSKLRGRNKIQVLGLGPIHRSSQSFSVITNACANYWKHHDEWERESLGVDPKRTISIIEKIGVDVWSSYPVSNIMPILLESSAPRFRNLLPFLKQWAENITNPT